MKMKAGSYPEYYQGYFIFPRQHPIGWSALVKSGGYFHFETEVYSSVQYAIDMAESRIRPRNERE